MGERPIRQYLDPPVLGKYHWTCADDDSQWQYNENLKTSQLNVTQRVRKAVKTVMSLQKKTPFISAERVTYLLFAEEQNNEAP